MKVGEAEVASLCGFYLDKIAGLAGLHNIFTPCPFHISSKLGRLFLETLIFLDRSLHF